MKTAKSMLACALVACALVLGCKLTPAGLERLESRVRIVAQLGAGEALLEHKDWKPAFQTAAADLRIIEAGETVSIAQVVAIVQRLPVKELQSDRTKLYVATGMLILLEAGTPTELNPDTSAGVKAVARGLRTGIENAVAYVAP